VQRFAWLPPDLHRILNFGALQDSKRTASWFVGRQPAQTSLCVAGSSRHHRAQYAVCIVPTPKELADHISNLLPNVKRGALRFLGRLVRQAI
jgi:hypothetical protein